MIPLYCKSEEGVPELEQKSTLVPNGRKLEDHVHVDDKRSVGRLEDTKKDPLPQSPAPVHEQSRLQMSSYIPVPKHSPLSASQSYMHAQQGGTLLFAHLLPVSLTQKALGAILESRSGYRFPVPCLNESEELLLEEFG
ncbi:UNVERIFIED_CONTAM: hypothetical protein FKN15_066919 [Acipenser sinensis]